MLRRLAFVSLVLLAGCVSTGPYYQDGGYYAPADDYQGDYYYAPPEVEYDYYDNSPGYGYAPIYSYGFWRLDRYRCSFYDSCWSYGHGGYGGWPRSGWSFSLFPSGYYGGWSFGYNSPWPWYGHSHHGYRRDDRRHDRHDAPRPPMTQPPIPRERMDPELRERERQRWERRSPEWRNDQDAPVRPLPREVAPDQDYKPPRQRLPDPRYAPPAEREPMREREVHRRPIERFERPDPERSLPRRPMQPEPFVGEYRDRQPPAQREPMRTPVREMSEPMRPPSFERRMPEREPAIERREPPRAYEPPPSMSRSEPERDRERDSEHEE